MAEAKELLELDPKGFKLNDYDNLRITMPEKPALEAEDVDAQLVEYAISAGKSIQSVAELDDEWVQQNFDGLQTIDDVRQAIQDDYNRQMEFDYSDMKFHACSDALVERLEGEVPEAVLQANVDAMAHANEERLASMNISLDQFLREEAMTPDQYERKLREETLHQLKLNMALDLLANVLGMQVGNHEITEYLQSPNPEKFLEEIREKGLVEEARRAAIRVKAMRRAVDTAIVNGQVETAAKAPEAAATTPKPVEEEEDVEIPDLENLPKPEIHDDNPFRMTILPD